MLLVRTLMLAALVALPACSDRKEQAQELLTSRLTEQRDVEFQNVKTFPEGVVCGEYRTNDPMVVRNDYRRFVVRGEEVENKPSELDWKIFCSKDPAGALFTTLGIGPVDNAESQLPKLRTDLTLLQDALGLYLTDNFTLPSSEQGLEALVTAATIPPLPMKFKPGGYIATLPLDPWGRPYRYERDALSGGVAQEFRLFTLGADDAPGGTGKDADVSTEELKYLNFIDP
jgi:type II secretion system protein G